MMSRCEWCEYKESEWLLHKSLYWSVYLSDIQDYVVDDIVPAKISYLQIKEELKKRVEEGKSIRNLIGILEEMEKDI